MKQELISKNIIKFGEFKLKSGITSNIYFDLRELYSYPDILNKITSLIEEIIKDKDFNHVCGIPYAGIPYASKLNKPMLLLRKEQKQHGMKKLIEGNFKENDKVILIDDVFTSGSSIEEAIKVLNQEKLIVQDVIVIIERENNKIKNYNLHSIFKESDFKV